MKITPREINKLLDQINLFDKNNKNITYQSEVNLQDGKLIYDIYRTKAEGKKSKVDTFVNYYNNKYNTKHISATDIASEKDVDGYLFHLIEWIADKKEDGNNPPEDFTGKLLEAKKPRTRKLNI
jgi:hypothetical protein